MKNFITNSKTENLKKRISELIRKSEELKFLVGFFYFSGIRELYNALKENQNVLIKILVGLNVDKLNYEIIEYADANDKKGLLSNYDIINKFYNSIKKSLNSEEFDNQEFYEQVKFFIELIEKDRLIIRKTIYPNHAKLYLFKLESEQISRQNLFITGSSNLTRAGLTTQNEFNVEISDYGFDDAENYFDELWDKNSILITEDKNEKNFLIEIIKNNTIVKEITPFEAFVLVLKIYLDTYEKKELGDYIKDLLQKNGYFPYQYQIDAISQALAIIEKNNGVIIADVVGLGKTIIACCIAHLLRKRGLIISPPAIMGDPRAKDSGWNMYKEKFRLYDWEVWSLGDLEKLQEVIMTKAKNFEVVIVDEAHRFRNQDTKNYEYLKNICRNKIVILITATPFNNKPYDILSLLNLFITPKKSVITLENNLVDKFKSFTGIFDRIAYIKKWWNSNDIKKKQKAYYYYKALFDEEFISPIALKKVNNKAKYLAKQIRDVIEPVTIRRNRLDLELNPYYKNEVKNLSKLADPIEWFYDLTKEQSVFYDDIIKIFSVPEDGGRFKGAIYRPFEYEKDIDKIKEEKLSEKENFEYYQQRNLYNFMRRLLVKRFESSFGAFKKSLINFMETTLLVQKFINKTNKYIMDRALIEKIYDKDPDEIEEYLKEYAEKITQGVYPKNHKIYFVSNFQNNDKFLADIDSDIKLFDEILDSLERLGLIKNDPKSESLIRNLKSQFKKESKRKIVIFSEYVDTVNYLQKILENEFPDKVLTVSKNLSSSTIKEINTNFDASYSVQEDKYNILLTSDKISEGFNLNRAGMIINYDIPWNPVRVIQRVGRINRISKKVFDELYIVNFFPTEKGAELVKSREIAANKMFLIHNILGEDAKIFDISEEPKPAKLYERIQLNPDKMEEESFYTKALNEFLKIKEAHPDLIASLDKFPLLLKVAKKSNEDELLVFIKKNRLYIRVAKYIEKKPEIYEATFEEVFEKICCKKEEKRLEPSEKFWDLYEEIKNYKGIKPFHRTEQSLEQKAINNLKYFIYNTNREEFFKVKSFLKTLLEDIENYGELAEYTLRRIANLEIQDDEKLKKSLEEIYAIKEELGEDYLEFVKARQKKIAREIIVAIENQKI